MLLMMTQHASLAGQRSPAPATTASLSLVAAVLSRGRFPLTFSLEDGECLALFSLSETGDERGVVADTLAGHHPFVSGRMTVAGQDVTHRPAGTRGIAVVSRREVLFDHLTVRENVAFPLRVKGIPASELRRLTDERLALLGLDSIANTRPPGLSDGQRLRAALARALATEPGVVILDDIFSGLDAETRRDIHLRLIRLRRARALSLLLITRDRADALAAARRIGVMADGVLLQLGDAATLIERPASPRVASAMGDANVLIGLAISVDDDIAHVRLACGGEMEAMADPSLTEGDLVELCVRPNQIAPLFQRRQAATQEESEGCLPATLLDVIHLGDLIVLRFRLADGTELTVHRPPGTMAPGVSPGSTALLAWRAGNALAFPSGGKQG